MSWKRRWVENVILKDMFLQMPKGKDVLDQNKFWSEQEGHSPYSFAQLQITLPIHPANYQAFLNSKPVFTSPCLQAGVTRQLHRHYVRFVETTEQAGPCGLCLHCT